MSPAHGYNTSGNLDGSFVDVGDDDNVVVVAVVVGDIVAVVVVVVVVVVAVARLQFVAQKVYRLLVTLYVTLLARVGTNVVTAHIQSLKHPRGECLALKFSLTGHDVWRTELLAIPWNHNPLQRLLL